MTAYPCLVGSAYATIVAAAPWISGLMVPRRSSGTDLSLRFPPQCRSAATPRTVGAVQDDIIDLLSRVRQQPLDDMRRRSARALLAELGQHRTLSSPVPRGSSPLQPDPRL